jgi:hypothetical protein
MAENTTTNDENLRAWLNHGEPRETPASYPWLVGYLVPAYRCESVVLLIGISEENPDRPALEKVAA